jgi:hypothetical protein
MSTTTAQYMTKTRARRVELGLCPYCGERPPRSDRKQCQECLDYAKARRATGYHIEISARFREKRRRQTIEHYGGCCACCGETELVFLTMDHIDGGGTQHNKEINGAHLAQWLFKMGFPEGFQVLCFNCNWAKSHGGCPHQRVLLRVVGEDRS